jgi:uncharacterized membrane protein
MVVTVVVVAWAVVPWIVDLVQTLSDYAPSYYEPKDQQRQEYLRTVTAGPEGLLSWQTALKLALLVLVGVLWLSTLATSPRRWRR